MAGAGGEAATRTFLFDERGDAPQAIRTRRTEYFVVMWGSKP